MLNWLQKLNLSLPMILLLLFTILAAFFGWLFLAIVGELVWFIAMPLIIAGMIAAAFLLIFIGWLYFLLAERIVHRLHSCG